MPRPAFNAAGAHEPPWVLSIGTTEPFAAAGLNLDLRLAAHLGIQLATVTTAVSAQNGRGLFRLAPVDEGMIRAQFASVDTLPVAAVRIGALPGSAIAIVAAYLRNRRCPVICDPVVATSAGGRFLDDAHVRIMQNELFPACALVTPNLGEAALLAGFPVRDVPEMQTAARTIAEASNTAILVKGGHLPEESVDVLYLSERIHVLENPRIAGTMRGTGCTLTLAIAAASAHGAKMLDAISYAQGEVRDFIHSATRIGDMKIANPDGRVTR